MEYTVLTVKQPFASLIVEGIKDTENRTWKLPEKYKGQRVLIHASKAWNRENAELCINNKIVNNALTELGIIHNYKVPDIGYRGYTFSGLDTGSIIGSVEIVDCVVNYVSVWAEKYIKCPFPTCEHCDELKHKCVYYNSRKVYNWVLANPILFKEPIMNVKGKLGLWKFETDKILK
ncbi:MAG TPA: ASCH domain-containing protein [Candidatus Paceibacterota bacterium]|nr:ASCH domain-containing protein [Candidatus Paceibacterota bacterium]